MALSSFVDGVNSLAASGRICLESANYGVAGRIVVVVLSFGIGLKTSLSGMVWAVACPWFVALTE